MGSLDQGKVENMCFGVHKKNTRGRYQFRKLQFDFVNQQLYNMEGDSDKAKRTLPFKEICLIKREEDNPLSFLLAFRDSTPYQIYARSKRDADLMVETFEKIIDNNKKSADTQVYYQFTELKRGYVMQKIQMGFQKRWLALYKWQLIIKREESDHHPTSLRALYNVPLAKYTDKQENGQLSHFIGVLFDDEQFVFKFEAPEQRDQWFAALLSASQDDRSLATLPADQMQLKMKSKEQLKVEQEVESMRSERMMVAAKDTEVKAERHRLAIVVDELRSRCAAAENEVQRLSMTMNVMDEDQKRVQENIKKLDKNIKEDDAKKSELEKEICQFNEQIAEIKHEITKADIDVKLKQNDVVHIDRLDDNEAVKRKRAVNSALNEGEHKIAALKLEQQETQKKSEMKIQRMQQLETEIEEMMNEVKSITTNKEIQLENSSKIEREQSEVLHVQRHTINSRVKELEIEAANSKEVYDAAIVYRNFLMDELEEVKAAETLLIAGDDSDSEPGSQGPASHTPRKSSLLNPFSTPSSLSSSPPSSGSSTPRKSSILSAFSPSPSSSSSSPTSPNTTTPRKSSILSAFSPSPSSTSLSKKRGVKWKDSVNNSPVSTSAPRPSTALATSAVSPPVSKKK